MPDQTLKSAKRIVREFVQSIPAPRDAVFQLLCPEREKEWLDGWDYRMVYSATGYAEEGCVFVTHEGDRETIWIITHHDPEAREIRFARITHDIAATTLSVRVEPAPDGRSKVHIRYTHTSLSEAGDAFLETITEEAFDERMRFWEASMIHYFEKGAKLTQARYAEIRNRSGGLLRYLHHRR